MTHLVIDPVTRVGGALRIEVDVANGIVEDAWLSGTMYRGIERIMEGRDPRSAWLIAQRICGTCGPAHALASVRAVEAALEVQPPRNARLLRNLIAGTLLVTDHVAAFYRRQLLDWVDVPAALKADPAAASEVARALGAWPTNGAAYFGDVKVRLARATGSAHPGPFAGGAWGHPAYKLGPELGLVLLGHALDALEWHRKVIAVHAWIGGKTPHPQSFMVGGMASAPPWGGPARPAPGQHLWSIERETAAVLSRDGLATLASLVGEARKFVEEVYLPDVLALASTYADWSAIGRGRGHFLAFGDLPDDDGDRGRTLLPRGRVMDADLSRVVEVGESGVAESVDHAWYLPADRLRRPSAARTEPHYDGPRPPYERIADGTRYSWVKAPRYEDDPMETGPLARILVATAAGAGDVPEMVARLVRDLGAGTEALLGTTGRLLAAALEAKVVAGRLGGWVTELQASLASGDLAVADVSAWAPETWPSSAEGFALGESPRGAIGHWVSIRDGRLDRAQVVDASTWNASPRDARGRRGAIEEALVGTPVKDPERPLELLRVVHAFDPCLSCGVH